jgi:DNA repair protein RecO (recombination protein O)
MQVYHNELKNLQRIKDMKWAPVFKNIFSDVIKNSVALFMVELLQKSLKQPETNPDLYYFSEDAFIKLDESDEAISANLPIYFALQLAPFLGIGIQDNFSNDRKFFDVSEGSFSNGAGNTEVVLNPEISLQIAQLLKAIHPDDLPQIKLNKTIRKEILKSLESYYCWHLPDFGTLKTLPVLHELF